MLKFKKYSLCLLYNLIGLMKTCNFWPLQLPWSFICPKHVIKTRATASRCHTYFVKGNNLTLTVKAIWRSRSTWRNQNVSFVISVLLYKYNSIVWSIHEQQNDYLHNIWCPNLTSMDQIHVTYWKLLLCSICINL